MGDLGIPGFTNAVVKGIDEVYGITDMGGAGCRTGFHDADVVIILPCVTWSSAGSSKLNNVKKSILFQLLPFILNTIA